jgi:hypothetical protein
MQRYNSYIIRTNGDFSPALCAKCGQDKPPSDYYAHSKRQDGATRYRPYCKQCRVKGGRKNWARPVHAAILEADAQTCKICNVNKPLAEFYANGCFADGTKKYRSRCKSCVLTKAKQEQPRLYLTKSQRRSSSAKNFISGILNHAAQRKQHLGFDLDLVYLLQLYTQQQGCCALSGVEMTYIAGSGRVSTNISIDRIDSSVGYLRGNVQFVCDVVNRMKQELLQEELLLWCKRILKLAA